MGHFSQASAAEARNLRNILGRERFDGHFACTRGQKISQEVNHFGMNGTSTGYPSKSHEHYYVDAGGQSKRRPTTQQYSTAITLSGAIEGQSLRCGQSHVHIIFLVIHGELIPINSTDYPRFGLHCTVDCSDDPVSAGNGNLTYLFWGVLLMNPKASSMEPDEI